MNAITRRQSAEATASADAREPLPFRAAPHNIEAEQALLGLILIGEDVVNAAYDSPVDFPPKEQIEEAETRLFSLAETDKYGQGFLAFNHALTTAIEMAGNAYKRDGHLSGIATRFTALDGKM